MAAAEAPVILRDVLAGFDATLAGLQPGALLAVAAGPLAPGVLGRIAAAGAARVPVWDNADAPIGEVINFVRALGPASAIHFTIPDGEGAKAYSYKPAGGAAAAAPARHGDAELAAIAGMAASASSQNDSDPRTTSPGRGRTGNRLGSRYAHDLRRLLLGRPEEQDRRTPQADH